METYFHISTTDPDYTGQNLITITYPKTYTRKNKTFEYTRRESYVATLPLFVYEVAEYFDPLFKLAAKHGVQKIPTTFDSKTITQLSILARKDNNKTWKALTQYALDTNGTLTVDWHYC